MQMYGYKKFARIFFNKRLLEIKKKVYSGVSSKGCVKTCVGIIMSQPHVGVGRHAPCSMPKWVIDTKRIYIYHLKHLFLSALILLLFVLLICL